MNHVTCEKCETKRNADEAPICPICFVIKKPPWYMKSEYHKWWNQNCRDKEKSNRKRKEYTALKRQDEEFVLKQRERCRRYQKERTHNKNTVSYRLLQESKKRYYQKNIEEIRSKQNYRYKTDPEFRKLVSNSYKAWWIKIKSDPILLRKYYDRKNENRNRTYPQSP